jgi:hypothetical protein
VNALIFPSEEALLVALTSGMVTAEIQATSVRHARGQGGAIAVVPDSKLPREVTAALAGAGVPIRSVDASLLPARCWAEVVRAKPLPESAVSMQLVLFVLDGDTAMIELAGELLRLGCDRQAYALQANGSKTRALLRAAEPPYYTVASALDRGGRFHAFVPLRPGQELVFGELGWSHPLKETIHAAPGEILLVPREGSWLTLKNGPWSDVYQLIDFRLPESPEAKEAIAPPRRLTVPLCLTRASRTEPASLWVIREHAIEVVDRLVQTLPDDVIARLLFAVTGDPDRPIVILRGRAGRSGPPEIDVPGEAYVSLLRIPNLFVPRDRIVEPPLRRDKIRELLAPADDELGWLAPVGDAGLRLESLPDSAFSPLLDWVDYLVEAGAAKLEPWVKSALFDFEPFVSIGVEWAEQPKQPEQKEKPRRREPVRAEPPFEDTGDLDFDDDTDPTGPIAPAEPQRRPANILEPVEQDVLTPDEEQLAELEQDFLDLEAPLDAAERTAMWAQMARLNGRLNRHRDAGICWSYALWEQQGEIAAALAREWAEVDTGAGDPGAMSRLVQGRLQASKPSRGDVRDVVAVVVSSHLAQVPEPSSLGDIHEVQVWLDQYDEVLDVRSLWLARHALAELVGGDRLALARTRDRILTRLRVGLSLERDVPNFLRFLGGGAGRGRSSEQLADRLEELLETYATTKRKKNVLEGPEELTGAYVRLVFAYGFARLGRSDRARQLREEARAPLDLSDPIHGFLVDAYEARIDQALEGKPLETPLPSELGARLGALAQPDVSGQDPSSQEAARSKALMDCYKIDNLREVSTILEPNEKLDPSDAWLRRHWKEAKGRELEMLRGMTDPDELAKEVDRLMDVALRAEPEERARLFEGLMDFFPQLPSRARRNLDRVLEAIEAIDPGRRALILQEALMLAGYFGLSELAQSISLELKRLLEQLEAKQVVEVALEFKKSLRALRRVGLKEEAADLLEIMQRAISGEGPEEMVARLQVAGGLIYLGDLDRAMPAMTAAHDFLNRTNLKLETRLRVHQAAASAWSEAPEQKAIAGLAKLAAQLKHITDGRTSNSHFCRSVIQFMEALVLGYASEHLALGELGRRWLDEDEYLIRRRIHRTLGAS